MLRSDSTWTSLVVVHGLSYPMACGILVPPGQGPETPQTMTRRGTHIPCIGRWILFFFFNRTNPHFYLFSRSLNPQRVQHHTDSVSSGLSRKVTSEFGMNRATVSMSSSYLCPDYSGFFRFSTRSYCVVLCFVHISTSLA